MPTRASNWRPTLRHFPLNVKLCHVICLISETPSRSLWPLPRASNSESLRCVISQTRLNSATSFAWPLKLHLVRARAKNSFKPISQTRHDSATSFAWPLKLHLVRARAKNSFKLCNVIWCIFPWHLALPFHHNRLQKTPHFVTDAHDYRTPTRPTFSLPPRTHTHTRTRTHTVRSTQAVDRPTNFFARQLFFFSFHARFEHTVPWVVGASSEAFTIPLALTAARERTNKSCSVSGRFNLRALVNQTTKQCVAPAKPLTRIVYLAHGCEQTLQSSTPAAIG